MWNVASKKIKLVKKWPKTLSQTLINTWQTPPLIEHNPYFQKPHLTHTEGGITLHLRLQGQVVMPETILQPRFSLNDSTRPSFHNRHVSLERFHFSWENTDTHHHAWLELTQTYQHFNCFYWTIFDTSEMWYILLILWNARKTEPREKAWVMDNTWKLPYNSTQWNRTTCTGDTDR